MSDSEYEEERVLAMVELQGIMNSDILYKEKPAKILDPESEHPVLQFGNYVFRGKWEETMGTVVCFGVPSAGEKDKDDEYKYSVKTDRKLSLQRVFLEEKPKGTQELSGEVNSQVTSRKRISNGADISNEAGASNADTFSETQAACKMHEDVNSVLMDIILKADFHAASINEEVDVSSNEVNREHVLQSEMKNHFPVVNETSNLARANASSVFEVATNSPVSNGLSSAVRDADPSRDGDSASEAGKKSLVSNEAEERSLESSEADFIILSEIECSNEASYDGSGEIKEPVGSTEGVGSSLTEKKHLPLHDIGNSSSVNEGKTSINFSAEGNSVAGIVRSLVTGIQDMESNNREASTSRTFSDDVADSASSLVDNESRQRQSESSLPLICDSASGEGAVISPLHLDEQMIENEEMDVSAADCSDVSQISTSGGIGLVAQYPDVFEDDAMDTTEHVDGEHSAQHRISTIPSDSEAMDLGVGHPQSVGGTSESYENRNEAICLEAGPSTSSGITRKRVIVRTTESTESVSNSAEENDSRISHSSSYLTSENYRRSKDSGLIDSTSNKVSCIKRNNENSLRSIPGIDSTTNESGKKESADDEELPENNSNGASLLNERIDSTMNNMNIAVPEEHVDFEMREATNMTEVEDSQLSDSLSIEENQPIDSTSSIQRVETYEAATGNVSDSSAVVLHESPRQSHIEENRNYSPCNVTESHFDESKPLSSFVVSSPGNCSLENVQSDVAESSEQFSESLHGDVTESDLHSLETNNITESSIQDDSRGASSSQVTESCASTSHKRYENHNESEVEDDSLNKVTESLPVRNYSSSHIESNTSTHEVTDSTNVSYPSQPESEDLDEMPLVIVDDSSVCEVTESSSSIRGESMLVIDESCSNDCLDSRLVEARRPYSQQGTESPSSAGLASGSDVTESTRFENASFFRIQDHNSSSGDAKEPSSSGLNTSESQVFEACSSADVISAENEMFYYSSAAGHNLSTNEASISCASGHWTSPLNILVQASEYEVSNSSEQNADSTEGDNRQSPNSQDEDPEGSDNSKFPSSTSN